LKSLVAKAGTMRARRVAMAMKSFIVVEIRVVLEVRRLIVVSEMREGAVGSRDVRFILQKCGDLM
jgi:hypothetical protein